MHVFELQQEFGLDHLVSAERDEPEPGPGQVRIRLEAASLNYRDLMMATGRYNPKQPLPLIPCSDGVGVVEALGEGVDRVREGDRVATMFCQGWIGGPPTKKRLRNTLGGPLDGTLTERMVLDQHGVSPVPAHLSAVEAATLPCAALTAWSALVAYGDVKAGDTVLVQGTGGVSLFALQIATALGARVIITSSQDWKLARARDLGAWREINYRTEPDWGRVAREMTDGHGVDHVIELGGAETLEQSLRAVAIGGTISLIGVLSGVATKIQLTSILMQNVRLQGILVGSRDRFDAMCRAFEAHEIRPLVDRIFPFEEAREAFAYLAAAHHVGKICVEM